MEEPQMQLRAAFGRAHCLPRHQSVRHVSYARFPRPYWRWCAGRKAERCPRPLILPCLRERSQEARRLSERCSRQSSRHKRRR